MGMEIRDKRVQSPTSKLHVEDHLKVVRAAISRAEETLNPDARAVVIEALKAAESTLEEALTELSAKKATPDH